MRQSFPPTPPLSGWRFLNRTWALVLGPDATRYLNGQVSIDIARLKDDEAKPACLCQAKGKLEAFGFVRRRGVDGFMVDAAPLLKDKLCHRLEKYLVSDDAEVQEPREPIGLVHAVGDAADFWRDEARKNRWDSYHADRIGLPGLDVIVPSGPAGLPSAGAGEPITEAIWEYHRVAAGIPEWGQDLDESVIPAEAGLDKTAVDFHKGCYVGQEVISRMKLAGKTNRQLVRLAADRLDPLPLAGMSLLLSSGEPVGKITSSAPHPSLDQWRGLGYVSKMASGQIYLHPESSSSPPLTILPSSDT